MQSLQLAQLDCWLNSLWGGKGSRQWAIDAQRVMQESTCQLDGRPAWRYIFHGPAANAAHPALMGEVLNHPNGTTGSCRAAA